MLKNPVLQGFFVSGDYFQKQVFDYKIPKQRRIIAKSVPYQMI